MKDSRMKAFLVKKKQLTNNFSYSKILVGKENKIKKE